MDKKIILEALLNARTFLTKNEEKIGESEEFQELADDINEAIAEIKSNEAPLKKICAWCKRFIGGDMNSAIVSHGICGDCELRVFEREKHTKHDVRCGESRIEG